MAKQSGLGDQLFIGGRDVGGDINAIGSLSTPREVLPSTGITVSAMERIYGKRDATAEFVTYFNDTTDQIHTALKGLPRTDVHVMYLRGEGLDSEAFCLVGKQVSYDPTRADDGALTFATTVPASAWGADWAKQLTTGKQTDTAAANSTAIDTTAAASFGWQAYLQVFSLGSGTAEITLEDSADNVTFLPLTGGAFTNATTRTTERLESASATATVRRYVRVATTGTFTNLVFAVAFAKNQNARAL